MSVEAIVALVGTVGTIIRDLFPLFSRRDREKLHAALVNTQHMLFSLIEQADRAQREQEAAEEKVARRPLKRKNGI